MKRSKLFCGVGLFFIIFTIAGCKQNHKYTQGYVDARYTYISSNVSGRLDILPVARGDSIQNGELLFLLEPEPEASQFKQATAAVVEARRQMQSAKAALKLAALTVKRQMDLEKTDATAIQSADEARAQYEEALASYQQSVASLKSAIAAKSSAGWSFSKKRITAPASGVVFDTYYNVGEIVPAGQPVLSLLIPDQEYIIFYVQEPMLSHLTLGQPIQIEDSENGIKIPAKITYISSSAEYTPPVIYSNETNDKLVFRIEATPVSPSHSLHPGEPVQVSIIP